MSFIHANMHKRRGHPGHPTSPERVAEALDLVEQNQQLKKPKHPLSQREIAAAVGVWSHTTISNWTKQDMDEGAVHARIMKKGWNKLLTVEQLDVVCGWVVYRWIKHKHASIKHVQEFVARSFGISVSPTWVSTNLRAQHLASHQVQPVIQNLERPTIFNEMVTWLVDLHRLVKENHLEPHHILAWDVKSFQAHTTVQHSYGPIGAYA